MAAAVSHDGGQGGSHHDAELRFAREHILDGLEARRVATTDMPPLGTSR
jgi:hypothetical protein